MEKNKQMIKISDLGLAASLVAKGFTFKDITWEGRYIHFLFENSEELEQTIQDFYSDNLVLPAKKVLQEYKTLKQMKFTKGGDK